ncbi:MAG TPA: SMP-30/gluconolactonase/LRE family protein [Burkholderiales bacterium]|nr:SMP-30/gluconolactonase/LRE family protein [Burkholderiales bacterium]
MKVVAEDLAFPEGPVVLPDGSVALVEIRGQRITRVDKGKKSVICEIGGGPNGLALGPGGNLYVCNNGGVKWLQRDGEWLFAGGEPPEYTGGRIEIVHPDTGKAERLYDKCDGRPLGAPNDIVFDADGNFWFTDPGGLRRYDRDHGAVFWARADGSQIKRVIMPLDRPNGIGLSPDGQRLYVSDTPSGRLWAWDITGPGEIRPFGAPGMAGGWLVGATADISRFDSLKVTSSGKIVVATLAKGGLTEFWPDGSAQRHHPVPDLHTTNLAFGGPDMRTAYVTCGGHGWLMETRWHEPGLKLHFN